MEVSSHATILLLGPEGPARELLEALLLREGFEVISATSGAEALACLPGLRPPCVALLDPTEPITEERSFLEGLHQDPAWRLIPLVISSLSGEQVEAAGLLAALKRICGRL